MAAKVVFAVCASFLLVQMTTAGPICQSAARTAQLARAPFANSYGRGVSLPAFRGGALLTASSSAMAPTGLSVLSQNTIQGSLSVGGKLPFLGAVAMEGNVPSAGAAAVNYSCGNGNVAITGERAAGAASSANFAGRAALANPLAVARKPCARSILY